MSEIISVIWYWLYAIVGGGEPWQMVVVPIILILVIIIKQSYAWAFYTFCFIQLLRIVFNPDLRAIFF